MSAAKRSSGLSRRIGSVFTDGKWDSAGYLTYKAPFSDLILSATIYHALGVPLDPRLGKDGVSQPLTTGKPLVDLFG